MDVTQDDMMNDTHHKRKLRLPYRLDAILGAAWEEGIAPSREECAYLLDLPPVSLEAAMLCSCADAVSRRRFGNRAVLLGQIGIETDACPGGCRFCSFGQGHTTFSRSVLSTDEILDRARLFTQGGDLHALFLMTMHRFSLDQLLEVVHQVRASIPSHTKIVVNIGDFGADTAKALRDAGVDGAYHVLRLREGVDTLLDPQERRATIRAIRDAGLDWYYCCEPIGPEHSAEELVDQLFLGLEYGCYQHAVMRRVWVPGSPLAHCGQITERRLAQVAAVVALATLACPEARSIAVHEPNLLGLVAGANSIYAEAGANPRDTISETLQGRGLDAAGCRAMLREAGFDAAQLGNGQSVALGGTPSRMSASCQPLQ